MSKVADQFATDRATLTKADFIAAEFFSLLALSLASIGLYGVATYSVVQRANEIRICSTLGAQTSTVLWMVLRESLLLLATGGVMGLAATLASKQLIQSQLFGLSSDDPLTVVEALFTLSALMLLAAYFSARRAPTIDPVLALRYE